MADRFKRTKQACYILTFLFVTDAAFAGPWLLPGSLAVKSDIDLLSDAGLIKAPVLTWPIAWVNIGPQLMSPEAKAKLPSEPLSVQEAYQRILTLYQQSYQPYKVKNAAYASGSNKLDPFRTFQYQPYADFASGVSTEFQTKQFAESVKVSYYNAPNQSYSDYVHLDNSYAYFLLGNWALGFDQFNRWWGPGYSDSMILSQNAEPFPALGIQRMNAEAFQTKWLHWIGPWSISSVVSEDGPSYYPYPSQVNNQLYWFTNVTIRPLQSLQFDVSRNVLFSGEQRPLNGTMLWYLVTMRNSYDTYLSSYNDAPGGEVWDIGTKWSLMPNFHIPLDFYQQTMFSDECGTYFITPDSTTFLLGTSFDNKLDLGTLRTYFEYEYNTEHRYYWWGGEVRPGYLPVPNPYGGGQYPYTYYGNILSSSLGSEAIGYTLGAILNESGGDSDTATLRYIVPNSLDWGVAGTPGYPFVKQDLLWGSLGRTFALPHHIGSLNSEIGYLMSLGNTIGSGLSSGFSATLTWSKNF